MNFYLNKFGFQPASIKVLPKTDLGLIVVIPCFNEPDIISTLNSLNAAARPQKSVEVIIVINSGEHHPKNIKIQNQHTHEAILNWQQQTDHFFDCHIILANELPKKHAGVGLARKIGMDEAVARFDQLDHDGIIACFDADAQCSPNYLNALINHFESYPKTPGCAIRYAHPLSGDEFDQAVYEGIINYELFLRYYNQGLVYAKLPFAYHTVGSSMAVRSSAYQKQGGMNKRKAGEDFYFLHKIIALGHFTNLDTPCVIPSPRTSDRVPFGTGKAINDWIESDQAEYHTYAFEIWKMLKDFVEIIPELNTKNLNTTAFSQQAAHQFFIQFLNENNFDTALNEIRANSSNLDRFMKRFFVWFNAFRVLKLVHYLRDEQYANQPIFEVSKQMAIALNFYQNETDKLTLLQGYRRQENQAIA